MEYANGLEAKCRRHVTFVISIKSFVTDSIAVYVILPAVYFYLII